MSRRSEELAVAVDEFNRVHDKWAADESRPYPDTIYWDAADKLFKAFALGDIPGDCRELAEAVAKLSEQMEIFDTRDDPMRNAYPQDAFWEARTALQKLRESPVVHELIPLESIKLLHEQKVSHEQIALIYNLRMPNGELAPHLVQRELDMPGSVIGKDWVDPRIKQQERDRKMSSSAIRDSLRRKGERAKAQTAPCPETPQELWEQKVSIAQSAMMLQRPMSEVKELFDGFDKERAEAIARRKREEALGGPLPEVSGNDIVDQIETEAEHDIDQEIIELHREGQSVTSIRDALQQAGHDIDGRKVAAVIRAFEGRQAEERTTEQEEEPATA